MSSFKNVRILNKANTCQIYLERIKYSASRGRNTRNVFF